MVCPCTACRNGRGEAAPASAERVPDRNETLIRKPSPWGCVAIWRKAPWTTAAAPSGGVPTPVPPAPGPGVPVPTAVGGLVGLTGVLVVVLGLVVMGVVVVVVGPWR